MEEGYRQSTTQILRELRVQAETGLSSREATRRLEKYGGNELPRPRRLRLLKLFLDRFRDVLVVILIAAGITSILLGHVEDAIIIAVAIFLDSALSFLQVWRTERTLAQMRGTIEDTIPVIRDGQKRIIPVKNLVIGDILLLRAGEHVPADARLLVVSGLRTQEAPLTGEAGDIAKHTHVLSRATLVADQRNMVFAGTSVVAGSGTAVVVATASRTQFGKIAQMLRDQPAISSPLRKKLQRLGIQIGWIIMAAVVTLLLIGLWQGHGIENTFRTAITLIVSAIPEDLTMILTIALTVGVSRILRKGGVVRKLSSGETLGAATVICTDKTGTLTEGNMRATAFHGLQGDVIDALQPPNHHLYELAYTGLITANGATKVGSGADSYVGSATERTAMSFAEGAGLDTKKIRESWRIRDTIAFSTKWKFRAALTDHPTQASQTLFIMGAPDVLLEKSSQALDGQRQSHALTSSKRAELTARIESLAAEGKRLVAVAIRRNMRQVDLTHNDINDLLFLGVLTITDPIRPEVAAALSETIAAGVAVKLITGDHAATARAIASHIGLASNTDSLITGQQLQALSDKELTEVIDRLTIFARMEPLDKQRIIRLLQKKGHVVAMTGDGINDAVALKSADIGVAMQGGSDVAREAADLVLLNNSFSTIVAAIKEGRVLRDNIRKVIAFLFATNAAEVAIFFVSVLAGLPLPLLPAQILWINLVTDGTSDIALSLEPAEDDVMRRRPEDPSAPLLHRLHNKHILFSGFVMTLSTMSVFWYLIDSGADLAYARTIAFTLLATSSLLSVWSFRSLHETIWKRGFIKNPWVLVSAAFSFLLHLCAIYIPEVRSFFGTVPLAAADWLLILGIAVTTVIVVDLRKKIPFLRN
ncbi:MAG: HAD-IC family P-type ATPase [Candidatus Andersenbacteria bacterium]|nr:HAD-IC family P-type ATPase [Candidatus Andersenbacteria bacterium]MBI3250678.1 HAD-IC family P-type ATPase [Candidatus Andersenbacteria bacterium]